MQSATAVANATTMRLADSAGVSATVLNGVASVAGDVVTTPIVTGLTAGHMHRLAIQFAAGGNTFQAVVEVAGERQTALPVVPFRSKMEKPAITGGLWLYWLGAAAIRFRRWSK